MTDPIRRWFCSHTITDGCVYRVAGRHLGLGTFLEYGSSRDTTSDASPPVCVCITVCCSVSVYVPISGGSSSTERMYSFLYGNPKRCLTSVDLSQEQSEPFVLGTESHVRPSKLFENSQLSTGCVFLARTLLASPVPSDKLQSRHGSPSRDL